MDQNYGPELHACAQELALDELVLPDVIDCQERVEINCLIESVIKSVFFLNAIKFSLASNGLDGAAATQTLISSDEKELQRVLRYSDTSPIDKVCAIIRFQFSRSLHQVAPNFLPVYIPILCFGLKEKLQRALELPHPETIRYHDHFSGYGFEMPI